MKPSHDERDDEREIGVEHPDLVLKGQEEHPLLPRLSAIGLDDVDEQGE
jgi:hypothetical protein